MQSTAHGQTLIKERDKTAKVGSYSLQPPDPVTSSTWRMKNDQSLEPTSINNTELSAFLLQGEHRSSTNLDMQNKGFPEFNDLEFIDEVPSDLYNALRFDEYPPDLLEYPPELLEYPVIDQGLFIV